MGYQQYTTLASDTWGISPEVALAVLSIIGIWSLVWKGLALWKSAGKQQPIWFIALLIINTAGVLEILYIFIFSRMEKRRITLVKKRKKR
jgi:hypothetical protein